MKFDRGRGNGGIDKKHMAYNSAGAEIQCQYAPEAGIILVLYGVGYLWGSNFVIEYCRSDSRFGAQPWRSAQYTAAEYGNYAFHADGYSDSQKYCPFRGNYAGAGQYSDCGG